MEDYKSERFLALVSKSGKANGEDKESLPSLGVASTLIRASMQLQKLVKSNGDVFWVEAVAGGMGRVTCNKMGGLLQGFVKLQIPDDPSVHRLYTFEPYIELAVKCLKEFGAYQLLSGPFLDEQFVHATARMNHLNQCVDKIRQEVKSERFLSRLNSYQRSSNKNYKELTEYVDSLFESYSRLLVLRVDLSYSKEYSGTEQTQAARDLKHLLGNARSNKMFAAMVGYVWKLEHGAKKGFHYHVMFFFDGSKVREDVTLAKRIGEYWVDVVTKGRGLYYNCNAVKYVYSSCGIGMINHADTELREGLRKALIYLTKADLYMKLQTEGRGMGRGARPGPKDSRGRPRGEPSVR